MKKNEIFGGGIEGVRVVFFFWGGDTDLVDAAQRGHIHGLAANGAGAADAGGVLAGARINDGVNEDLEGVLGGKKNKKHTPGDQKCPHGNQK